MDPEAPAPRGIAAVLRRRGLRQLVKFSLVGASSTAIDKATLWALMKWGIPGAPWWLCAMLSFALAVTNSFFLNRAWTFRARDEANARRQFWMFLATNVVGMGLNLLLTRGFLAIVWAHLLTHDQHSEATEVLVASVLAVPFVVLWNFAASKYWTFRAPKPSV